MPRLSQTPLALIVAIGIGLGMALARPVAATAPQMAEVAFDSSRGLGGGWRDLGWAPREVLPGKPARLDMSDRAGWILSRKGLVGKFGEVLVLYSAPADFGDFLEVRLDSSSPGQFPRVPITSAMRRPAGTGWMEALVPLGTLNPRGLPFEQILVRARIDVGHQPVYIGRVGLTAGNNEVRAASAPVKQAAPSSSNREGRFIVDCRAPGRPINPMIYGVGGGDKQGSQWLMNIGAKRWGGNPSTRYNWQIGHAWNTGNDYFFRNVDYNNNPAFSYDNELAENLAHGVPVALTVPTIGWVAKDTSSYSFPVSVFGPQEAQASENPDMGNGKTKEGVLIPPGPPTRTSVPAPPEFVAAWLRAIREKDQKRGRSIKMVILDNEPMLWNSTHRDVHPAPATYNELLQRTITYGTAVRKAYPEALIAGPAEWGWTGYFYSAADSAAGIPRAPDRRAHRGVPLLPWWLFSVREHERKNKIKLIDVLDVHYYPQGANIGVERSGATDPATNALRLRSTRSLWDPTYVDESWVGDRVELFPRLRRWIKENAPGVEISLGEYSFGAAEHMSGGLAEAEALGRFGTEGIFSAFFWFMPPRDSPVYWAFRAFRNFDGKGGRFLDRSAPVLAQAPQASLFASRSETGDHVVAVLLNLDPDQPLAAEVDLSSCAPSYQERVFTYGGGAAGFKAGAPSQAAAGTLKRTVAPYSITVLDLTAEAKH
jgi:hypothetical protein